MKAESIYLSRRNCQVRDYIERYFSDEPERIQEARRSAEKEGLKPIHVSKHLGKTLYLLASLQKPKRILEIGTLGGYSTLWLAKALDPMGKLITLECEQKHIQLARENISKWLLSEWIEVRQGRALSLLKEMVWQKEVPFDLIFIDADKSEYPEYLELCLKLSKKGTLILSDNLIPKRGEIGMPDPRDNEANAIYAYNQLLADHPQLETILLPTLVGEQVRLDALGVSLVI